MLVQRAGGTVRHARGDTNRRLNTAHVRDPAPHSARTDTPPHPDRSRADAPAAFLRARRDLLLERRRARLGHRVCEPPGHLRATKAQLNPSLACRPSVPPPRLRAVQRCDSERRERRGAAPLFGTGARGCGASAGCAPSKAPRSGWACGTALFVKRVPTVTGPPVASTASTTAATSVRRFSAMSASPCRRRRGGSSERRSIAKL